MHETLPIRGLGLPPTPSTSVRTYELVLRTTQLITQQLMGAFVLPGI
jgi:hypothetical protein